MTGLETKNVVLLAPFWGVQGHPGFNRLDRFVRWLSEDGYRVVVVRAGSVDGEVETPWGLVITVQDKIGLYRDSRPGNSGVATTRKPNKFRRALAYWLFSPDPTVVWARSAAKNASALRQVRRAAFILSSSPPESVHVAAWLLFRQTGTPYLVDMRDGWLDEPLKPMLYSSALRRWWEGRLELRILNDARVIQVTSRVWERLLLARRPHLESKLRVLTNGYPQQAILQPAKFERRGRVLIHAGRFIGSRLSQLPELLLGPLLRNLSMERSHGVIKLIGPLSADELALIEPFEALFEKIGWKVSCPGSLPRDELLVQLSQADGLLLLSASFAAIPSKLFEYIHAARPIFVVTSKDSATWRTVADLKQVTLVDMLDATSVRHEEVGTSFYRKIGVTTPYEFSEDHLRFEFLTNLAVFR